MIHEIRAFWRTYGKGYLRDAFRWRPGRQGTGYDKMLLLLGRWPMPFDTYLIRYPDGASVPPHRDPVPLGGRHFRINVVLKAPTGGGDFVCADPIFATRRIKFFRPDLSEHSVTSVSGTRYVLSVGWIV